MNDAVLDLFPSQNFDIAPSKKEGLFNIVGVLRFIDQAVVGTFNDLMDRSNQGNRKIEMFPYKSDRIELLTNESEDIGKNIRLVTYRIKNAQPAALTGGMKDLKYRQRQSVINDTLEQNNSFGTPTVTEIKGKWIDYTIRFDCFAPTWQESQTLLLEFEDILDTCSDFITSKTGVVKFINMGRSSDIYHMKTSYFYESLMYLMRIEKQKRISSEAMMEFNTLLGDNLMSIIK